MAYRHEELLVFDLDGTLLGDDARLSSKTMQALQELDRRHIPWTVATGRMPQGARQALPEIHFKYPQAYKNGVLIWDLMQNLRIKVQPLQTDELLAVCQELNRWGMNPWLNTLNHQNEFSAHIKRLTGHQERAWADSMSEQAILVQFSDDFSTITDPVLNVFALTKNPQVLQMAETLAHLPNIQVYSGHDFYYGNHYWLDIHHVAGNKGDAVRAIQQQIGAKRLVCFGDSDNDISMLKLADEAIVMANGREEVKAMADQVIGDHREDGIAHFLAQRYGFVLHDSSN